MVNKTPTFQDVMTPNSGWFWDAHSQDVSGQKYALAAVEHFEDTMVFKGEFEIYLSGCCFGFVSTFEGADL